MFIVAHASSRVFATALLGAAAIHDIGLRTLPDTISLALLGVGGFEHWLAGDLGFAMLAAAGVFALGLLCWWLRALGGGDAKILGATALAVPVAAIPTFLFATAMAGGVLAVAFLALRPLMPRTPGARPAALLARVCRVEAWRIRRKGPLPYAVAIAAGGVIAAWGG